MRASRMPAAPCSAARLVAPVATALPNLATFASTSNSGAWAGAARRQRAVDRKPERPRLGPFLEPGLGIARRFRIGIQCGRPVTADEALGGFEAAVDVKRADDRLAGIREVGRIVAPTRVALAAAQGEVAAERKPAGYVLQRLAANQRGIALGKRTLGLARERLVQHRRHDHAEHAVAQEFEPLVVAGLRSCARMAERERKQCRVCETVAEGVFEGDFRLGGISHLLLRPLRRALGR